MILQHAALGREWWSMVMEGYAQVLQLIGTSAVLPLWPAPSQFWAVASNSGAFQSNRRCIKCRWCCLPVLWCRKKEPWLTVITEIVIYSCKHLIMLKAFCELGGTNKPTTSILQSGQNCFHNKWLQSLLKEKTATLIKTQASRAKSEWEIMPLPIFKQNKVIVGVKNE